MKMDKQSYGAFVQAHAPKSPLLRDCASAFFVGGMICIVAQGLNLLYVHLGLSQEDSATLTSVTLVAVAALLTGLGWFAKIAKFAGAGTLVPITGFANAVVSPAIDCKAEGWVLGVGAKIFTVAGPVLLYGTLAGTVWGIIYWIVGLF